MQKHNQGQQTEMVKKQLISLLHEEKLQIGDRLPSQAELRKRLSVGSKTIQRAIDSLADGDILEVRPHKGVFVKQLKTNGFIGQEIGLVCMLRTCYPYAASLMQCLQLQMHTKVCQCQLFLRNFPEMTAVDSLSYFDGLKRCIEQKKIQGLITTVSFDEEAWDFFRKNNMPVVSLGSAAFNTGFKICGSVELDDLFEQSRKRGFRRPAVIHCGYPLTDSIRKSYVKNCQLPPEIYCRFLSPELHAEENSSNRYNDLKQILYQFRELPANCRPDVLLIPDDFVTSVVHSELLKMQLSGSDWMPFFIYQTTRQVPILPQGSIPGDHFENDTMKIASAAINLLLNVISGKETQERTVYIKPQLYENKEMVL